MRASVPLALVSLLAAFLFAPLHAQIPGGPIRPAVSGDKYRAHVMAKADTLLGEWRAAWRADDAGRVVERYSEGALLVLPDGRPLVGREEIGRRLEDLLPRTRGVTLGQLDFGASTRIGFRTGSFEMGVGDGTPIRGRHLTLVMHRDGEWRIRSQFFFPAGGPPLPADPSLGGPLSPERTAGAMARRDEWESYREGVFAEVVRTGSNLARAWREGDAEEAGGMYHEHATLWLPWSDRFQGRAAIESGLRELLPRVDQLHTAVLDFDAGGKLAYVHGRYYMEVTGEDGTRETVVGPYVLLCRIGSTTVIRGHYLERPPGEG